MSGNNFKYEPEHLANKISTFHTTGLPPNDAILNNKMKAVAKHKKIRPFTWVSCKSNESFEDTTELERITYINVRVECNRHLFVWKPTHKRTLQIIVPPLIRQPLSGFADVTKLSGFCPR